MPLHGRATSRVQNEARRSQILGFKGPSKEFFELSELVRVDLRARSNVHGASKYIYAFASKPSPILAPL